MVWGSLTLDGIAKERGWKPGSFQNENFDMRILHKIYGDKFLNSDAVFCAFAEMNFDAPMFCRPVHDKKHQVMSGFPTLIIECCNVAETTRATQE